MGFVLIWGMMIFRADADGERKQRFSFAEVCKLVFRLSLGDV